MPDTDDLAIFVRVVELGSRVRGVREVDAQALQTGGIAPHP